MKILYHHRTRAEDAQGIHIAEIQRAFRELGHDVLEVALVPAGGAEGVRRKPGAMVRIASRLAAAVPPSGYELLELAGNAVTAARLAAAVRRAKPDLVYERYSLHNAAGALATRAAGVPLVLEVNAPLAEERAKHGRTAKGGGLAFPRLAARVERAIWRAATAIVTVSTPLADVLVDAGVERRRILVLPNAVRREMSSAGGGAASVRAAHGFAAGDVVFGFTGWFRPWHGLEAFLEAFADANLAAEGARVMLVGEGQALPALRGIVARRKIAGAVAFTGAVGRDAISDHIAAFDVALQPHATRYASPMKIFEYLALGKPVVAVRTPAISEVLDDGGDSILFEAGDIAGLVGGVRRLLQDRELRVRMSSAARETVTRRGFFWDENARRTLEHLSRLDGRPSTTEPVRSECAGEGSSR